MTAGELAADPDLAVKLGVVVILAMTLAVTLLVSSLLGSRWLCWFRHKRAYVAIRRQEFLCLYISHRYHNSRPGAWVGRWVCERCPKMGERCFGEYGAWTVHNKAVVPDEKAWANYQE